MLHRYRRYWAIFTAFLLALPLAAGVWPHAVRTVSSDEARLLAPAPAFPTDLGEWQALPRRLDAYLRDHFGLRASFLQAYAQIMSRIQLQRANAMVLTGLDGRMFFRGQSMLQQSAGLIRNDNRVAEVANVLAAMRTVLDRRHSRLLVASPPNASTIYADRLPLWARNRGQRTEYDVLLSDLAARGIQAVDLRPVLTAARTDGEVYLRHDTHWTARGAVAAFNAIVQADSHPDWKLDPDSVLGPPETVVGGDLARLLGEAAEVSEPAQLLKLPAPHRELMAPAEGSPAPYLVTTERAGPTIMIIGDSFTEDLIVPMLLQHVSRAVWVYHNACRFEWKWIDQLRPDEVWYMPTERQVFCLHGDGPVGMGTAAGAGGQSALRGGSQSRLRNFPNQGMLSGIRISGRNL
jgi:hypothetical protein